MIRRAAFAGLALGLTAAGPALGRGRIDTLPLQGTKVRIDGLLREWGRLDDLDSKLSGSARDAKASAGVGYDDKYLYVAFKIRDDKLVRTKGLGSKQDHGTLIIAFPSGGGFQTYPVDLFPGDPGKQAGAVAIKGRPVKGAQLVEAPVDGGYTIEAKIPWSAFSQAKRVRVGLRGALRFTDADSPGRVEAVIGTSTASAGKALPPLLLEGEQGLYAALIGPKNLSERASREAFGDVSGSGALERVAVHGNFLTITGAEYRGGKEFFFADLGVRNASMVRSLNLRDLDGDGKQEIILQKRVGASDKYRQVLQVYKLGKDDAPFVAFAHEVGIKSEDGELHNDVDFRKQGSKVAIVVSQGKSEGFEPDTYDEPTVGDIEQALLPWSTVKSRTYEWTGSAFEKVDEQTQAGKVARSKPSGDRAAASSAVAAPPPPRPPTADEMLDRVYALYRKDRGVKKGKPRFDFVTDVAGDGTPERVLVHDKDVVVFGKGYRAGASFAYITIGVADAKDVLHVTARDLTGDGKAEILVRGVLHAKASKALGGDVVERHALFVYRVTDSGIDRIFAAETGRQLGDHRILGTVAFESTGQGVRIELRPGQAVGWTERSYPFPPDTTAAGGLEPLLLPWGGESSRRYTFQGSQYRQ